MRITRFQALKAVSCVASAVMVAATINEMLAWALVNESFASSLSTFWFVMLVGALPLPVAVLIAVAVPGIGKPAARAVGVRWLRLVAGIGFVPIFAGGFLSGFGFAVLGLSPGSPALSAFYVWQYLFVAAVIADVAVFVMALLTPTHTGLRHSSAPPSEKRAQSF
jgi:hypothetical protein